MVLKPPARRHLVLEIQPINEIQPSDHNVTTMNAAPNLETDLDRRLTPEDRIKGAQLTQRAAQSEAGGIRRRQCRNSQIAFGKI